MLSMKSFIDGVRKEPCLWNPLHPQYREIQLKDAAWQRVVDHYNSERIPTIPIAKMEWKKLRDNHRDALKRAKLGKNKLLPAQITTWKYAKAMQFLEPFMKYRVTENIEINASEGKGADPNIATAEATESPVIRLNKREPDDENNQPNKKPRLTEKTDALDSFFKSMLESTRDMPHWMQTQVKKKLFAIIIEAEEQLTALQRQNTNCVEFETSIKSEVVEEEYLPETII